MLELAIAEAVEHAERMLKTFESGCAVAQDLLQMMIDKLEAVRQSAQGAGSAANVLGTVEQDLKHAESAIEGAAAGENSANTVAAIGADAGTGAAAASPDVGAGAPMAADQPTT